MSNARVSHEKVLISLSASHILAQKLFELNPIFRSFLGSKNVNFRIIILRPQNLVHSLRLRSTIRKATRSSYTCTALPLFLFSFSKTIDPIFTENSLSFYAMLNRVGPLALFQFHFHPARCCSWCQKNVSIRSKIHGNVYRLNAFVDFMWILQFLFRFKSGTSFTWKMFATTLTRFVLPNQALDRQIGMAHSFYVPTLYLYTDIL